MVPRNFATMSDDRRFQRDLQHLAEVDGIEEAAKLLSYLEKYQNLIVIAGGGILWRPIQLLAHCAGKSSAVEWRLPELKPEVVREHVHAEFQDITEEIQNSNCNPTKLLGVLPRLPRDEVKAAMMLWGEGGLQDVKDAEQRLAEVVEYCTSK